MDQITESIKKEKWASYRQGLEKRKQLHQKQLEEKFKLFQSFAEKIAMLDLKWFHHDSDIDIAVEGLAPALYIKAHLSIETITDGEPFHLIDMKDIPEEFKTKIISTGRLL
jgi:predicted nucleotidyltransferase